MADAVVGRIKAVVTADATGLTTSLDRASRKLKTFGDNATRAGRTLTTRLTLPLAAVGTAAVKTAADFERSMTSITALVGVAASEVRKMEGQVRSMAVQFGKSGTDAANALFFITSAGLRGATATDTLAASLKASAIGLGDTATIADLATSALNAYGADTLSAAQATDVMTAAVREGKLEASELAGSMGRVLPLASAMGVEFNEVGAAFAALSRTGTNAAEAATQIRGILSSLLRPTKQAEDALAGMGLSSEGLRQQIQEEGLLATLKTLSEEFAGNEAAAAAVFGNIRALSGVLDLMGANVATTEAIFASMADTTGAVDEAFAVVSETASFQFQQAMAQTKDSLLTLGQELMPMVTDALELIKGTIESVTSAFAGMSDGGRQMVTSLLGIAAVAGPIALGIGSISKALVALKNANPWVLGLTTAFTGLAIIMGDYYREASEARARQEALTEEFKQAGDPAANLTDRLSALADEIKRVREEAEGGADAIPNMIGAATLQGELSAQGVLDTFNDLGVSIEDLIPNLEDGSSELENLLTAFELGGLDQVRDELQALPAEYANLVTSIRMAIMATEEDSVEQIVLTENLRKVIESLVNTGKAFDDNTAKIESDMQALIDSGDVYRDFADLLGEDTVTALLAMVGNGMTATEVMEEIANRADAAMYSTRRYTFMADLASGATDGLTGSVSGAAGSFDDFARTLVAAGELAGYDIQQIAELANQIGILDGVSAEVMVELGLNVIGGDALVGLVDDIIRFKREAMLAAGQGQFILQALEPLYTLRRNLIDALASGGSSGGGGGGGGGVAAPIDEAAQAAERLQQQLDALSHSVAQLGESYMGRDFAETLFGASPDEIANIFEDLVGEMDRLGLVTEENGPAIIALGEQFKAAASAAEELAQATADLAAAQDLLDDKQQVVKDLRDEYKDFREEFFAPPPGGSVGIMGQPGTGLDLILNQLDAAIPELRRAQSELEGLRRQRDEYKQSVADLFKPQLSADGNVMAQTQRLLGQARAFRDNILALRKKGFPPDVIAEVVNAGLQGGAKLGAQLLRMGTGEMSEFLSMREEIARLGAQTSRVAADVLFTGDIADAERAFEKQRGVVAQLFQSAIAEARKQADEQEKVVNGLKEALEAATNQMAMLVDNIQVNLFNAFNNFLSKIGGEITTLTTSPYDLSVNIDLSAIERLTNLIADVTDTTAPPAPTPPPGGGGGGGGTSPAPAPAPAPERTYTVESGDGPYRIIQALTGSASGWSSKARKLWEHNGLYWNSNSDWQTIHPGMVLRVPALAKGGRATGGMPHLVGEMGPELFVPDSSGYVVPNHALGGGDTTVNVTINTHAGMRAEDIVREIEKYTRRRGQVSIPTTGNRRF